MLSLVAVANTSLKEGMGTAVKEREIVRVSVRGRERGVRERDAETVMRTVGP